MIIGVEWAEPLQLQVLSRLQFCKRPLWWNGSKAQDEWVISASGSKPEATLEADSITHTQMLKKKRKKNVRSRCCILRIIDSRPAKENAGGKAEEKRESIPFHWSIPLFWMCSGRRYEPNPCRTVRGSNWPQTHQSFSQQPLRHVPCLLVCVLQRRRQPQLKRQTVSGPHRLAIRSDVHVATVPVNIAQLRGNTRTLRRLPQQVRV